MSQEDVEVVRRAHAEFLAGFSRGDPNAAFDSGVTSPDFEWIMPENAPGLNRVYRGAEGWADFIRTWTEELPRPSRRSGSSRSPGVRRAVST